METIYVFIKYVRILCDDGFSFFEAVGGLCMYWTLYIEGSKKLGKSLVILKVSILALYLILNYS